MICSLEHVDFQRYNLDEYHFINKGVLRLSNWQVSRLFLYLDLLHQGSGIQYMDRNSSWGREKFHGVSQEIEKL